MLEEKTRFSDKEELSLLDEDFEGYGHVKDFEEFSLPENKDELSELLNDENITVEFIIPNGDKILIFFDYQYVLEGDELKEYLNITRLKEEKDILREKEQEDREYSEKIERFKSAAEKMRPILKDKGYWALKTQRDRTTWLQVKCGIKEKNMINDIIELSLPEMREILEILIKGN